MRSLLFAFLLAPVGTLAAQRGEPFTLAGSQVAIYNLAGDVRVERGTSAAVTVEVTRQGRDADRIKVETGPIDGAATLRVVYDGDRIVYPKLGGRNHSSISVRRDGRWGEGEGFRLFDRVQIRGSGSGIEAWADLVIRVPDGMKVTLHHAVGAVIAAGVHAPLMIDLASASFEGHDLVGDLTVDGGSGSIALTNVEGRLSLDLGSGSTVLRNVKARDLHIDSGSGGVSGERVTVEGLLDLDAGSGRTELRSLTARRAKMDLGSGGMTAEFLTDVDDLKIDSGSGSVTLYFPPNLGAELEIDTGSGGISSEFAVATRRSDPDRLMGTVGDGKGHIVVDAGSGSVRLKKLMAK